MTTPLRIGAVQYINTRPLIRRLDRVLPEATITCDVPSRLADDLLAGRLDVALIPSATAISNESLQLVGTSCIACRGPVRSVLLLARRPLDAIRTVAGDPGSRTSNMLVTILLKEVYGVSPRVVPREFDAPIEAIDADAMVVIGDPAMARDWSSAFPHVVDLGEAWRAWTGLPFVFAYWTACEGLDLDALGPAFDHARDLGLAEIDAIAEEEAAETGLPQIFLLEYLTKNLHFEIGPEEREALQRFRVLIEQESGSPSHLPNGADE